MLTLSNPSENFRDETAEVMLSPRNPIESQVHLLNSAGATKLVYDPAYSDMAIQCQKQMPTLVIIEAVTFDPSLYTPPQTPNLPLGCLESDAYERIVLVMHSSGTTGVPKLIRISNRYALNIIRRYRMNQDWCQKLQGTMLIMSPIFHLFGLVNFIWFFSNFDRVVFPISFSPNHILNISEEAGVSLILLLPYQLKQLAEYCTSVPKKWSILARMNGLHFGGAPLAADLGRTFLSHNICLLNGYGTTETGFMAGGISGPENPDCCKLTLVHGLRYKLCNNYDDTAQLCILSDDENLATDLCKGQDGYLLADRLRILNQDGSRVHFEVLHRVDDTLVHPTGEKTYPVSMENSLLMSPLITRKPLVNYHSLRL
ncbi:hypothetical protein L0F63_002281 [Massospora cicadina]|nr:hypothetical protein L0F63_002281 [Massospora cicadina]